MHDKLLGKDIVLNVDFSVWEMKLCNVCGLEETVMFLGTVCYCIFELSLDSALCVPFIGNPQFNCHKPLHHRFSHMITIWVLGNWLTFMIGWSVMQSRDCDLLCFLPVSGKNCPSTWIYITTMCLFNEHDLSNNRSDS